MAIRVSEVKSSRLSSDNKEIIVDSTGKYTGDLELRFARECVDQLIQLLGQAREGFEPSTKPALVPEVSASAAIVTGSGRSTQGQSASCAEEQSG